MNQLSLNLIAITVFGMTMSALLGPLVNLSPTIPAVMTAGLLGFAALDTFGWQGQGSTILMDWFAGFSVEHRDRVLRHEAGHFLVAQRLQIPVTNYTLNAWEAFRKGQAGRGGVEFDTQELEKELQAGSLSAHLLDRYCTIWMAGSAAEHLVYGDVQGGQDDFQKLRFVLNQLRFTNSASQQKERWSALQAKTLLQEHWDAYEALVAAMQRRASVSECIHLLEQHCPQPH